MWQSIDIDFLRFPALSVFRISTSHLFPPLPTSRKPSGTSQHSAAQEREGADLTPAFFPLSPEFDTNSAKSLFSLVSAKKLPLQQGHLSVAGRLGQFEGLEEMRLVGVDGGDAVDGLGVVDAYTVPLDGAQLFERAFRGDLGACELEAAAHDPVQD